ncbi:site-2 protease family protein [Candidatus Saganbacteria bacterium]|nr:site-2 protease family protein [Candidatus Saganbacteria bacterium]
MLTKSFKLITLLGIPVTVSWSWFIIFGLVVYTLATGYFPIAAPEIAPPLRLLMALISAVLLFACLLAHELSHSYVAQRNKLPISGITLFIFGGVAHLEQEPEDPGVEFKMAIAGPIMSLALGIFFYFLSANLYSFGAPKFLFSITGYLAYLNFGVGLFNLLPGFPLDGGRIMRSLIWKLSNDLRRATMIASSLGKGMAYILIGLGLVGIFQGTLINGLWLIFVGLFLNQAAEMSYRSVLIKRFLTGIKVRNLMTKNVIAVPADILLSALVEKYFFKYRFASFPVLSDDTLLGLVTFHDIKEVPKEEWGSRRASEVMLQLKDDLLIHEDEEIAVALQKIAHNQVGRLLVIDDDKLIGIISQRDIMKLLES